MTASYDPVNSAALARVALALLVEPGSRELGGLVRRAGPEAALAQVLAAGVSPALAGAVAARLAAERITTSLRETLLLAERATQHAARIGARIVVPADDEWPLRLEDLTRISRGGGQTIDLNTDPPLCLWVRGPRRLAATLDRSVAVVGARAATAYGTQVAAEIAYELAARDWTVVSGGAFGIDAAAHRGAMAGGGATVVVLASGLDRPYPLANSTLFEQVAEEGLIISEWPPGAAPHRQRFLTRNRVIAAGTLGTVIVEAAARSGARHTLGRARLLGRPAMAVPGPIGSAMSVGCHIEMRGLDTRLVTNAAEIIEEVGRIGDLAPLLRGEARPHDGLDPVAAQVLDAVSVRKISTADEIAAVAGVSGRQARRALPQLVDAGLVQVAGGGYRLAPARRLDGPAGQA